jgi:general secretion pathway protein D
LATSSNANVLSSPRILARNGETAMIQVGSEIPTITQQQTTAATAGSTGVLQSVQYRNTGVILRVKPTIYAGDRIDLDVTQEVSDSTRVGVAGSPIIDTRKVETKLSLKDGAAVLLGGLISQNNSRAESGVPLLKDIPGVGQLFRTNTDNNRKTELLVLITPYILADDHDAQEITGAFRNQLGAWAQPQPKATQANSNTVK